MAYPYYNYNPTYYPMPTPYINAQAQNAAANAASALPTPNTPSAANSGLQWVQGETGAKSYYVAPNTTVLLMDSEAPKFYLKTVDASGMPLPLRVFKYEEVRADATEPKAERVDLSGYVTRDEFDKKIAEITKKPEAKGNE